MLAWAAEASQVDISAGLALALLALVAVLPEYAVDFVFTWKAGKNPAEFAPDALANMTGGNQLLIGAGWSLVVLVGAYRIRQRAARPRAAQRAGRSPRPNEVELERSNSVAIAFLLIATIYGLTLPLHRTLDALRRGDPRHDLRRLHGARRARAGRGAAPRRSRAHDRLDADDDSGARSSSRLFAASVITILVCAEPFAESLVDTGPQVRDRRLRADLARRAARVGGARAA